MSTLNKEHIEKVFSDEAFVKSLLALEEPQDVQTALKEKGVEVSLEEVKQMGAQIAKAIEAKQNGEETDELSFEQLDDVAGGSLLAFAVIVGSGLIAAAAGGTLAVGFLKGKRW